MSRSDIPGISPLLPIVGEWDLDDTRSSPFHPSFTVMPRFSFEDVSFSLSSSKSTSDSVIRSYSERIKELKDQLKEDDLYLCPESEHDFWRFVELIPNLRRGGLAASDEGILRAIWDNTNGDYIGLEFHGENRVLYCFFRDTGQVRRDQKAGWDTCENVVLLVEEFRLSYFFGNDARTPAA